MLLGPLGLQGQLIGHLEGLAQRQDDLIGQVLGGNQDKEEDENDNGGTKKWIFIFSAFKSIKKNCSNMRHSKLGYLFNTLQNKHCQRRYDPDTF